MYADASVLNDSVFRTRAGDDIITGSLSTLNADVRHRTPAVIQASAPYASHKDVQSAYNTEKNIGAVVFGKV